MYRGIRDMLGPITAILASLCRLARRREGNIAILFGLSAIPLVIGAGIAINSVRAYTVKTRLGAALDAAALAVGSEVNQTPASLTTYMNNYFAANYPASALGGATATVVAVPGNASLTASTVNFQASATVPMTFMQLVGINTITVSATSQIKRTAGLEVVLVLDNTGSMLCGPNDGAPNYNAALCATGVVASDTSCTNASNESRICTLINAATSFVNTLTSAITASAQLYIGVVPYVTTVNVGSLFCTGATTCTHIQTDNCSGDWINKSGVVITEPATPAATATGNTTNASKIVTNISPSTSGVMVAGMLITGTGIPAGTTIASVDSTSQIHLSANATSTRSGTTLTVNIAGNTTSGSTSLTSIAAPAGAITVGTVLTGTGLPATGATVSAVSGTTATLCQSATSTHTATALTLNAPINYDTTHTATTPQWMGCVVEPTSSGENSGVAGVINSTVTDPDTSEPAAWPNWYPFWWVSGAQGNGQWYTTPPPTYSIKAQTNLTEVQGNVTSDWDQYAGPNQGCPEPMVPLTDVTASTGKTQILSTIKGMWPRDAGGTQVHIGMIWGWRVISPNGPFAPVNGHPLSYANATNTGWKKVIVLMTDGTEEWPSSTQLTGLGQLSEGKINTTSSTATAQTNLNTRLQTVCDNIAANGNIVVYTIGLGSDGASNAALQNCPTGGGTFSAADTSNLQQVFNDIAQALIALRLTQ